MEQTPVASIRVNRQEFTALPQDLYIPPDALQVFLETFEGPLDLLLYLIRKQNLDIAQIPIAEITQQYLHYINSMQVLNLELAGEYLLMAAMLLEIKSRLLLPKPPLSAENAADLDPRQELIQRLIAYQQIKHAAQDLNQLPQANRDYLWAEVDFEPVNLTLPQIMPADLSHAWQNIRSKNLRITHHLTKPQLSIREQMSHLMYLLTLTPSTDFLTLIANNTTIAYIVTNFIALLELAKAGLINLTTESRQNIIVKLL